MEIFYKIRKSPLAKRLAGGMAANVLGKAWVVLVQLLSIPVLSAHWGADGLGTWLVLSGIPTYIALGGFGFANAGGTDMIRLITQNNILGALGVFQSVWLIVTITTISLVGFGLFCATIYLMFINKSFEIYSHILYLSGILGLFAVVAIQANIVQLLYRSTGRYASGTAMYEGTGLIEGLSVIVVSLQGGGMIAAAISMLVIRSISHILLFWFIARREPWIRLGFSYARRDTIIKLLRPSFASFSMAAAYAIAIQGVLLVLASVAGPAVAASFSIARTLNRLAVQASDLVGRASLPELTVAFAANNRVLFRRLTRMNVISAIGISAPISIGMGIFGPPIATWLSRGHVHFEPALFPTLAFAALLQSTWQALGQSLVATNDHHRFTHAFLIFSAATCIGVALSGTLSAPATIAAALALLADAALLATIITGIRFPDGNKLKERATP